MLTAKLCASRPKSWPNESRTEISRLYTYLKFPGNLRQSILFSSSHHAQKRLDDRILRALVELRAKRLKIRMQSRLGEDSTHIGEGES